MPERAFNIRLFLPDGDPSGRRIAVRSHHTAELYCVSRAQFPSQAGDARLQRTGVYALVGPSGQERFDQKLYVGQGGRVGQRIKTHLSGAGKDWWTEVFVLTKTDGELDQADIDHLEARLIKLAKAAERMELDNAASPNPAPLADYKEAEVAAFLDDVLPIYKALGLVAFEPGPQVAEAPPGEDPAEPEHGATEGAALYLASVGVHGEGRSTREGFVVVAESTVRKEETPTIPRNAKRLREELLAEGHLAEVDGGGPHWSLTTNQVFRSPSEAACVITGSSVSGPYYWRTIDGTSLGDLELAEAEAHEDDAEPETANPNHAVAATASTPAAT